MKESGECWEWKSEDARDANDICRAIVDTWASGRVWGADVERFFKEIVKNATTCARQSSV